jgi:hypothetical protein
MLSADIVANVYVRNISMSNAQNGARIKVFGGSNDTSSVSGGGSGYVKNITFEDFRNTSQSNIWRGCSRLTSRHRCRQPDLPDPVLLEFCAAVQRPPCHPYAFYASLWLFSPKDEGWC